MTDRIEDAMGQIEKYDAHLAEKHIQYAVEDILARLVQLESEPMVEVEITGKEMVEALQAERRLRREAERRAEGALTTARKRAAQMGEAERRANKAIKQPIRAGEREHQAEQRAERAETLAQLVTSRLSELLERLAWCAEMGRYPAAAEHGREYAAKIKEALDDSQA